MHRPRVKVGKSCQGCRRHRKKCDGRRPQCGPCLRRGYVCAWTSTTVARLLESSTQPGVSDLVQGDDPTSHPTHELQQRTADRLPDESSGEPVHPKSKGAFAFSTLNNAYGTGQNSLASTTDFGNLFDEHAIISGVLHGWEHVKFQFLLDEQWPHVIGLDHELVKLGYATAPRMAILWFARMKMKVIASVTYGLINNVPLPEWATADLQLQIHMSPFVNYLPWPSIRRVAMSQPRRFCNPKWSNDYMKQGIRFVWSFESNTAYTTPASSTSMVKFTPEFMLRVTNLRSWTLTKDFLDANPELRGFAPQSEPSATTVQVSPYTNLEPLYWRLLRRRYEPLLDDAR